MGTLHSYGQFVLIPWGFGSKRPDDHKEIDRVAVIGGNAMKKINGHYFTVGNTAKVLYPAAGGSDDWAKGGAGIRYSYTIELPDTGTYGFILPANRITQVGEAALSATKAMIQDLLTGRG